MRGFRLATTLAQRRVSERQDLRSLRFDCVNAWAKVGDPHLGSPPRAPQVVDGRQFSMQTQSQDLRLNTGMMLPLSSSTSDPPLTHQPIDFSATSAYNLHHD